MRRLGRLGERQREAPDRGRAHPHQPAAPGAAEGDEAAHDALAGTADVGHVGRPDEEARRQVRSPVGGQAGGHLDVELQAVRARPHPEGLVLVGPVAGQPDRALGQGERVAVPVHARQRGGCGPEDGVSDGVGGQVHLAHAELGSGAAPHLRAQRGGELLRAETHAEHGQAGRDGLVTTALARGAATGGRPRRPWGRPGRRARPCPRPRRAGGRPHPGRPARLLAPAPESAMALATDPGPSNATCCSTTHSPSAPIAASGDAGDPEQLGRGALGQTGDLALGARHREDALRDGVGIAELALVAHEGSHLACHRGGRVHRDGRSRARRGP